MIFEGLPGTPTAEELEDQAFSRAARAGRAKSGVDAQLSMLQTAANVIGDNLQNVVKGWPDFDQMDPFYYELADAVLAGNGIVRVTRDGEGNETETAGIDALRQALSQVGWASRKATELRDEYQSRVAKGGDASRKHRKQAFARLADVVEQVDDDLTLVRNAREQLRDLPELLPDEPTIVVAGYPNVGKSSFVNGVTRARNETASYPFTTTGIGVGHLERDHVRYQLVDTPGLLDRPAEDRNDIESQAVSALEHLSDCVLVFVDASESCGYPLEDQLALRDDLEAEFGVPVLTVCNKADLSEEVDADHYVSVTENDGLDALIDDAVERIGFEPELPYDG
ncbi:NOG1 family protein [Salinarchaeum laminariae]|uniref:NOG1 family protein n=1 Tax=Salinarchaeum laminariae TaxID=869888 RepID=UPI0020BF59F2|nr:GTPase [Salinarchaeum laminariae]